MNNDIDVEMYGALPDVTNNTARRGLKDLVYVLGNVRPETPEPAPKPKRTTILTSPDKGSKEDNTSKGTGILTVALFVYQAQINKAENDKWTAI